jgi:peptidoglycan/xylan/chitin deacetylase (PgdA/CDA1 family)
MRSFNFRLSYAKLSIGISVALVASLTAAPFSAAASAATNDQMAQDAARLAAEFNARQEPRLNIVPTYQTWAERATPPNNTSDGIYHCGIAPERTAGWITFDDSGTTSQIQAILSQLRRYNARATFFPTGQFASDRPDLITLIKNEGHFVGNHTYSHPDMMTLSTTGMRSEITRADAAIKPYPSTRKVFRAPYGSGSFSSTLNSILTGYGYQNCFWTVDTRDWSGSSASTIINRVKYGDSYTPPLAKRGVILMHMHGAHTSEAIPGVMEVMKKYGYPKLNP